MCLLAWVSGSSGAAPAESGSSPVADPRPPIKAYIRTIHERARDAHKHDLRVASSILAVDRSNTAASVDDLKAASGPSDSIDVEVSPPDVAPPTLPEQLPHPEFPEGPPPTAPVPSIEGSPSWSMPPQIADSVLPAGDDGLAGNRQVALTPFPNLNIQSGPLAKYQLPWSHKFADQRPFSIASTLEFQTAVGLVGSNGGDDSEVGWYNSGVFSAPFWKEKGVGVQFAGTFEPTTFPQILVEMGVGAFHRAIWAEDPAERLVTLDRVSWGLGFDGIFDFENDVFLGQQRSQLAYAVGPNRELGFWFALPLGDQIAVSDTRPPVAMQTSALISFYYRHVWPSELDGTILVGATEQPGGFHIGGYLSYRVGAQFGWFAQGLYNADEDAGHSLYSGIRIYFRPLNDYSLISGNPLNRYRAFMPVPDHINLQIRKTDP